MISLKEFKKSLGSLADQLSESEILKLREQQDKEAEILYSLWLESLEEQKITT